MAVAALVDTEDERAGRQLAAQAETILNGRRGDIPPGFVGLLFGRTALEDLLRYDAKDLASARRGRLGAAAGAAAGRAQGRGSRIALRRRDARLGAVSIIEIVNDDMPFLLDSVLGELGEQAVDVRLVVHPIFTVERDARGKLVGFHGAKPAAGAAARESFIHIHIGRIDEARCTESRAR